jgi:L-lactate dehydrogenase (cytochrome)
VGGTVDLLMDGGIRSGLYILRALACGANGVLIGRPWAFALAAGGGAGVRQMLNLLRQELLVAMALTGHRRIADVGPEAVLTRSAGGEPNGIA